MDHWRYHHPDVEVPDTQLGLLNWDGLVTEGRPARAQQADAARVADVEATLALDPVGNPAQEEILLPFATAPGAALTF